MKHWGRKKGGYDTGHIFSHAARFIWIEGELYLFGSVDNGYQPILFRKHYDWDTSNFAIMRRKAELSGQEKIKTTHYCLHLDTISISYQYWNFIQWLCLVYLNWNLFKKDSDKITYCYESERKARKDLNPENYQDVYITDIFNLLYDPNYKVIYISKP
jgi:hypothetical protein